MSLFKIGSLEGIETINQKQMILLLFKEKLENFKLVVFVVSTSFWKYQSISRIVVGHHTLPD